MDFKATDSILLARVAVHAQQRTVSVYCIVYIHRIGGKKKVHGIAWIVLDGMQRCFFIRITTSKSNQDFQIFIYSDTIIN